MMVFGTQFGKIEALVDIISFETGAQKVERFMKRGGINPHRIVGWSYAGRNGGTIKLGYIRGDLPNMHESIGWMPMSDAPAICIWDRFKKVDLITVFNPGDLARPIFLRDTETLHRVGGGVERFDAVAPITDIRQVRQYVYASGECFCLNSGGGRGIAMARYDRENRRILALGTNEQGKATRIMSMHLDTCAEDPTIMENIEAWQTLVETPHGMLWFSRPSAIGLRTRISVAFDTAAIRTLNVDEDGVSWDGIARKPLRYHIGTMDGRQIDTSFEITDHKMCVILKPLRLDAL